MHVYLEKKKKEYFNWKKLLLDDDVDITPTRYVSTDMGAALGVRCLQPWTVG